MVGTLRSIVYAISMGGYVLIDSICTLVQPLTADAVMVDTTMTIFAGKRIFDWVMQKYISWIYTIWFYNDPEPFRTSPDGLIAATRYSENDFTSVHISSLTQHQQHVVETLRVRRAVQLRLGSAVDL